MTNSPLSVFMHPRAFWFLKFSGVSRYVCELAEGLTNIGVDVHIPIRETINEYLRNASFFEKTAAETCAAPLHIRMMHQLLAHTPLKEKARRHELRHQGLQALRRREYDIIHPTHNNAVELLPYIGQTPLVITVHDMTHELFSSCFPASDPSSARKRIYAQRANRIIAISECTKNDLVRLFNISPDKIDVIHHGNSLRLPPNADSIQLDIPGRYVLFVGGRNGYKNFARFAEAFAIVASEDKELHLICAGGGTFSESELAQLHQLGIADRCQQRWVTDEELAVLYNRAQAFVYPSEYEGFGLPILEAYECGAPVLCAQASCFPEIAAKGALYFKPLDIEEMAHTIRQTVQSPEQQAALKAAGQKRLQDFSWQKTAEKTLETYLKVTKR